ncbi:MAG: Nif11-like leader peptide family natural product precursor [Gemmatimonas sp.]
MAIKDALAFIRHVRENKEMSDRIEQLGTEATLEQVADLGVTAGFAVTAADLRSAHRHDWGLRWAALVARADAARPADANPVDQSPKE